MKRVFLPTGTAKRSWAFHTTWQGVSDRTMDGSKKVETKLI